MPCSGWWVRKASRLSPSELGLGLGEEDSEHRAAVLVVLRPYAAAVQFDDLLDDGESCAAAAAIGFPAMEPLKDAEDGVKKRASVPSWDEIMFGKKPEE